MLIKPNRALALFCASVLGSAPTAVSAQPDSTPATTPPANESGELSDSRLALYVLATQKLATLQQQKQLEMERAETAEQARRVEADAHQRLVNAVDSLGMTVDEYNKIAGLVEADPETKQRVEALRQ